MALTRLAGMLALLASVLQVGGHVPGSPSGMTALAATVLAAVLLAAVALAARATRVTVGAPLISRSVALREKSWCAAFLRQRDPDAAGRARPRAPSAAPAAA